MPGRVGVMGTTYAVVFRENGAPQAAGSLALTGDRLWLDGSQQGAARRLSVPFADLTEIRIGRSPRDRLNGHPTLVLERAGMPAVQVAPVGAGLLHEIASLVAMLAQDQVAFEDVLSVVVPLKPGSQQRARRLLELGPPLDPAVLDLRRHYIYLSETEAVFVFEGPELHSRIKKAVRNPAVWRAGLSWQRLIAGRPGIHAGLAQAPAGALLAYNWVSAAITQA